MSEPQNKLSTPVAVPQLLPQKSIDPVSVRCDDPMSAPTVLDASSTVLNAKNNTHTCTYHLRLLGSDLMSEDDRLDEMLSNSAIHVHPERLTPSNGVNLNQLVTFANCRTSIRAEPSKVLFVSLPDFGTAQGGKNSNCSLRNLSQLILIHLEDPSRQVIIDGAAGNFAW